MVEEGAPRTQCLRAGTKNMEMPGKYKDLILLSSFWHNISFTDEQDMRFQSPEILGSVFYILS